MGEMTLNKIFGAGLAVVLVILGLLQLPSLLFASGAEGHHDDHHGEHGEPLSLNEQIAATYAYYIPIADGGSAGPVEPEEVFDLGAALASADVSRGQSSFQQKCASCHSIEAGAGNGIGPNLYNVVGAEKHHLDDFRYSGAMMAAEGSWTYADLNDWLKSPSSYMSGTSMGFAGLNRDGERANVIAYLASKTEGAPAFPAPLPEVTEEEGELVPEVEDTSLLEEAGDTAETMIEDAGDSLEDVSETVEDTVDETVEEASELVDDHAETHEGDEH
ncbi:MAG: cytochrome c family protein [Hyphomonadaceae bacterium]|nr:cytochrome c family protein [Hyphomonadaceae bacterium]